MARAAAAACVPLGLGLYLSFSRGALFAGVAGLVTLLVLAPRRDQLRAVILAVGGAALAAVAAAPFHGVSSLSGGLGTREGDGAIVLVALAVLMGATVALHDRLVRAGEGRGLPLPRHAGWIALGLICGGLALAIVVGAKETTRAPALSSGAGRLVSLQSNRYDYWKVAFRAFGDEPFHGVGAGGWAVWWLRYRTINDYAQDAHSLPLQTAAELGLVGLAALGMLFGGVAAVARRVHRGVPGLAAGPIAALVVYAAHSPLDWDWQMPAVTLVAVVLAGMLVGATAPQQSWATRA
jgi:O-antigen ligase